MKHRTFLKMLYENSNMIEAGFTSVFKEFSVGHGRIDIIGKDKNHILCLVEVKLKGEEIPSAKRQIRKYQTQLLRFLECVGIRFSIRALIVTPSAVVDLGVKKTQKTFMPKIRASNIPTSREVFGLKGEIKP